MFHDFNYPAILAASSRAAWEIDDVIPQGARLDFSRLFMPEALARTAGLDGLSADEKRLLNQIRGHDYLCIFGLVEEFILPFILDHARPQLNGDDYRVRADQWERRLEQYPPSTTATLLVARRDELMRLNVTFAQEPGNAWRLAPRVAPTAAQLASRAAWLGGQ